MALQQLTPRSAALRAALYTAIRPRLDPKYRAEFAADSLTPVLLTLRRNQPLRASRKAAMTALAQVVDGKLAQDADIDDVANLLDAIEEVVDEDTTSIPEEMNDNEEYEFQDNNNANGDAEETPLIAKIREFLKSVGVSDEVLNQFDQLVASESEPEDVTEETNSENDAMDQGQVGRQRLSLKMPAVRHAMDEEAINRLVEKRVAEAQANIQAVYEAKAAVRPVVGELALAYDSADQVYEAALKSIGLANKIKGVDPSSYRAIFDIAIEERKKAGRPRPRLAADTAGVKPFHEMFPTVARIGN